MKTTIHTDCGRSIHVRPLTSGRVSLGMIAGQNGVGAPLSGDQVADLIQALTNANTEAARVAAHNAQHAARYQPGTAA